MTVQVLRVSLCKGVQRDYSPPSLVVRDKTCLMLSRVLGTAAGKEGLAEVLLALLHTVLSFQPHWVALRLVLKYPPVGGVEEAALKSTLVLGHTCLHLAATVGRLIERTLIGRRIAASAARRKRS